MKGEQFLKEFVELCNKHDIKIKKNSLSVHIEPKIHSYRLMQENGRTIIRETHIGHEFTLNFIVLSDEQDIYEFLQ